MAKFYRDQQGDALAEWQTLAANYPDLAARLLGVSGAEIGGALSPHQYVNEGNDHILFRVLESGEGADGYLFYRYCRGAPSKWLIVGVGLGEPNDDRIVQVLVRFYHSSAV